MDRSSFGSALGGENLGGNEDRTASKLYVPHRSGAGSCVTAKTPRAQLERQSHGARTNPSSCPARATVSDGRDRARHRLRRAHVSIRRLQISGSWHRASVLFAEVGARYRVAPFSHPNGCPKGSALRSRRSAAREPARECWARRRSEQSRRLNVVPTRTALRVVPKQDVVRLFIPIPWHDERTRLSHERRFELETGA